MLDRETLVRDLVRLRRVSRRRPDDDLSAVQADLERAAGSTIRRAVAARLLGVSQTALDRWISAGDVPVVVTEDGRREVPLNGLVDLVDRVWARGDDGERHPLASEIRARRLRADRLDLDALLPRSPDDFDQHRGAELRALAFHRAVAQLLDDQMVADARAQLRRWRTDGRIHPRYGDAWATLLDGGRDELAWAIGDDESARDLRQSSPFAGLLDEPTRRRALSVVGPPAR